MGFPLLTTLLAMLTTLVATVTPDHAAAADPPGRIGRLSYLSGNVQFTSASQSDWTTGTAEQGELARRQRAAADSLDRGEHRRSHG